MLVVISLQACHMGDAKKPAPGNVGAPAQGSYLSRRLSAGNDGNDGNDHFRMTGESTAYVSADGPHTTP